MIQLVISFLYFISSKTVFNNLLSYKCNSYVQTKYNYYKLAHVVPLVKSVEFTQIKSQLQSQEIIINGINSYYLRNKLIRLLNININHDQIISKEKIEKWIEKIKLSGFFTNVTFELFTDNQHQIIYINVSTNSLLKMIKIVDYKSKIIPSSYINYLFKEQLGKPINFISIDKTLKLIKKWYIDRGYSWVDINVQYTKAQSNSITINIFEGVISQIEIIGFSKDKNIDQVINGPILDILQAKPGYILNKYVLERGIKKLKQKKILLQCYYEIQYNMEQLGTFKLLVNLETLNKRSTYLFSKAISISSSILESAELWIYSSIKNSILCRNIYYHSIQNSLSSIINHYSIYNRNRAVTINMSENDLSIYSLLCKYDNKRENYIYLRELYLNPVLWILGDNLGCKHYMKHLGLNNTNLIIDARLPKTGPYFKIQYEILELYLLKKLISEIYLGYFQGIDKYHYNHLPIISDEKYENLLCYKNSILHKKGLLIGIKYDIQRLLYITQQINLNNVLFDYRFLKNSIKWTNLNKLNYSSITSIFRPKCTQVFYSFLKLKIQLLYDYFNINPLDNFFNCESIYFIPRSIIHLQKLITVNSQYTNKIIITMKKSIHLYKHLLLFNAQFINVIGPIDYLPYSEEFLIINPQILRGYPQETLHFPSKFAKLTAEYHVPIKKQNSILLFIDYANNIDTSKQSSNYYILPNDLMYLKENNWSTRISYGIGCQIFIPFQQIPPLRFEYAYNIDNGQYFHLRINK
uniref:Bacterial surface antigen (D15) domain-containing protein n=1 Tax=Dichotomaria marginata TaxID=268567 RepID=A0A1G4NSC7_9FLOR|nr:Hypothetical protein ORF_4 [Dichotomaria marginata]SCW21534.1 Hypothetical protein ORF_4 [Dichotomaria marginata]